MNDARAIAEAVAAVLLRAVIVSILMAPYAAP